MLGAGGDLLGLVEWKPQAIVEWKPRGIGATRPHLPPTPPTQSGGSRVVLGAGGDELLGYVRDLWRSWGPLPLEVVGTSCGAVGGYQILQWGGVVLARCENPFYMISRSGYVVLKARFHK